MTRLLIRVAALLCLCTAAHAQSTLQVLDYGAAPRAPIRYQFTAGQTERVAIEIAMTGTQEVNGQKVPSVNTPPIRTTMSVHVTDVAADGSARIEWQSKSSEAAGNQTATPANQALLNGTLALESLLSGWYRSDTRGRILENNYSMPDGAVPAVASQMINDLAGNGNETVQQFPDEAVGPGAHWQVVRNLNVAGIKLVQTADFTLRSRSGDRIELDEKMQQGMGDPAGALPAAGMQGSGGSVGTGKVVIDLHKLTPMMTMEVNGGTTMTLPAQQGQPQSMKMTTQMRMSAGPATD